MPKKVRNDGNLDQSGGSGSCDSGSILKAEKTGFPDAFGERFEKMK